MLALGSLKLSLMMISVLKFHICRRENGDIGGKTYNYDDDPDDEYNHPPILRLREDFTV